MPPIQLIVMLLAVHFAGFLLGVLLASWLSIKKERDKLNETNRL